MNQKDWIEYFEVINDRKPTPQEFAAAKEAGEFESDSLNPQQTVSIEKPTQVNQQSIAQSVKVSAQQITQPDTPAVESMDKVPKPKKKFTKKTKTIVFSILGVLTAILLIVGGYSLWRYQSGKLASGVYEEVYGEYYDYEKKKWIEIKKESAKDGVPLYDFVVVKGDNYQYHSFWKLDSGSYVYPTDYDSTVNTLKLYPWEKQAKFQMSFSEYESEFTKLRKNYPKFINDTYFEVKESYQKKSKTTVLYEKNGDMFTEKNYDEDGKLFLKRTFRRLSKEDSRERLADYDRAVEEDKKERQEDSDD